MLSAFVLSLLLAPAQPAPVRPADGTYSYTLTVPGAASIPATIVVQSAGATFTVSESAKLGEENVLTRTTYDAATLLPTHYEVHQRSGLANVDLMAAIAPQGITFPGLPLKYTTAANAKFILLGEGMAAYRVMMPWTLLAQQRAAFTFAALNGNQTLSGSVVPVSETRPASVPATDTPLAAQIGSDTLTFWYNAQTGVTDEIDAASGTVVRLQSYASQVTELAEPGLSAHAPLETVHYTDSDVSFASSGGAILSGTLSIPDGDAAKIPAIVLVHGSGAETRDGGTPANPTFLLLANALANRGIAVLRYDKRGIGKSTGVPTEDWHPLGDDVRAAVAFLKRQPRIDARRIFVLGHSEGGTVVPLVANSLHVRGIVLMAAPALPLHDILMQQGLDRMSAHEQQQLRAAFASYDNVVPAAVLARVRVPMLLLQGSKDGQVLATDFPHLVRGAGRSREPFRAMVLSGDDHLFDAIPQTQTLQRAADLSTPYPLDARVPRAIAEFIAACANGTPRNRQAPVRLPLKPGCLVTKVPGDKAERLVKKNNVLLFSSAGVGFMGDISRFARG